MIQLSLHFKCRFILKNYSLHHLQIVAAMEGICSHHSAIHWDYNRLKHILLEHNIQKKLNNRWWVPASIAIRSRPCHVSPNESLFERLRLSLCCNQSMHGHGYLLVVYCLASKDPSNLSTWPASVTPRIALLSDFLLLYLQPQ